MAKMKMTLEAVTKMSEQGVFTLAEAINAGLSQPTLSRLTADGVFSKIATGVYADLTKHWDDPGTIDFIAACKIFGENSYVGGHSALDFYGLCNDFPRKLNIVVPPHIKSNRDKYRVIRTKLDLSIGVDVHASYKIASPTRAVLDAMHFSHLWDNKGFVIGVYGAAIRKKITTFTQLQEMSEQLKIRKVFETYARYIHPSIFEPV